MENNLASSHVDRINCFWNLHNIIVKFHGSMMNTEVTRADTEFIADIDLIFKLAYYVHRRFSNIVNKKVFF